MAASSAPTRRPRSRRRRPINSYSNRRQKSWLKSHAGARTMPKVRFWELGAIFLLASTVVNNALCEEALRNRYVIFSISGQTFRIPEEYLTPRPAISLLGAVVVTKPMSFSFWMPTGLPPSKDVFLDPNFRPHINSNISPGPDTYLVHVSAAQPINEPDRNGFVSPSTSLARRLDKGAWTIDHATTGGDWIAVHPVSPADKSMLFYMPKEPQALLKCLFARPVVNPTCFGNVYFEEERVSYFVMIPYDTLNQGKKIFSVALRLIKSWQTR